METGNQFLGTERVSKLMRQYAIPCIMTVTDTPLPEPKAPARLMNAIKMIQIPMDVQQPAFSAGWLLAR